MESPEFDFVELAYQRFVSRFSARSGFSIREYYKLCGRLFHLRKRESWHLLRAMKRRYGERLDVNHMRVCLRTPLSAVEGPLEAPAEASLDAGG